MSATSGAPETGGRSRTVRRGLPPGPREPGILQALKYTWRFPRYTAAQHARHGPSYTLRLPGLPPTVVTSDRTLIRHMLTGNPLASRHANDILGAILGDGSIMMLEPADHLARRRLLLPPFHGERMKGYAALVRDLVREELDGWPAGGSVRVHDRARRLTLAVIQSAVLGVRDDSLAAKLGKILDTMASPFANLGLFAPALQRGARGNVQRLRDRLDALMVGCVRAARADPALDARTDVLALLVRATDEHGRGLTDAYVSWTVKEVLRVRTVAPVSVARTLLEDAETQGHVLPRDTVVVVDAFSLHRDPELYPDPAAFRPQRFDGGGPPPYAYLPYGSGAHRCPGAALATLQLEVFLGAVAERHELSPGGPPAAPVRRGPTLVPAGGAIVRVQPRS